MLVGNNTILEVERLSKLHSRAAISTRRREAKAFGRSIIKKAPKIPSKLSRGEFWSLKDISFNLERGEALGVIGSNGAGKTTLLRILAGQILPDKGEARIYGTNAAMIDLQAGFNPKSTGRANIFLKGAMLGRSQKDLIESSDEIISFAELGHAIDAPFGTYSSGMKMRLAFSVMMASEPDVMFIDEILAVGDFRFRQKCLEKIRSMRERVAFVLVSHSMNDIEAFCTKVIVLSEGEIVFKGAPKEAIDIYENMKYPEKVTEETKRATILKPQFYNEEAVSDLKHFWCNSNGQPITRIATNVDLFFNLSFRVEHSPRNLIIGVPVWTESGTYVTGFSTQLQSQKITAKGGMLNSFRLKIPAHSLNPGEYISNVAVNDGPECLFRRSNDILTVNQSKNKSWGIVTLPHNWVNLDR